MTKLELEQRLKALVQMIDEQLSKDMLTSSQRFLRKLSDVAQGKDDICYAQVRALPPSPHVIISCDASIKNNPGGPAAVGFVIQDRDKKAQPFAIPTPSKTNNQAEYDAIYESLRTFINLCNNPLSLIEVRSDSQVIVNQLNGVMVCRDPILAKRRESILELTQALPVPVQFVWRPRNSTPELELANHLAQDLLGVPRH